MIPEKQPEAETAEEAKVKARKNLEKALKSVPHKLQVKIDGLPKHLERIDAGKTDKLRALFRTVDQSSQHLQKFAACKRGCSSCCFLPVSISAAEVEYIEKHTGAKRTSVQPHRNVLGEPCPFVEDGECSIYEHRPYACRRHLAFTKTSTWCDTYKCNEIEVAMVYSEGRDQFPALMNSFLSLVGKAHWDIRQVFSHKNLKWESQVGAPDESPPSFRGSAPIGQGSRP